jgi:hypothetical protein
MQFLLEKVEHVYKKVHQIAIFTLNHELVAFN